MKKEEITPPKKRGRPPEIEGQEMVLISAWVTAHQRKVLGASRSKKVRQALALAGFPEQPITT